MPQLRPAVHGVGRDRVLRCETARRLFDKYKNYKYAFYTAPVLAVVALLCELIAKRPRTPEARAA